jgi:hypothetical protein
MQSSIDVLLDILAYPSLNRHILYTLTEMALCRLFPEWQLSDIGSSEGSDIETDDETRPLTPPKE